VTPCSSHHYLLVFILPKNEKTQKSEGAFLSNVPQFPKQYPPPLFFTVARIRPFVQLVKATLWGLWWNDTDRGNGRTRARTCFSVTLSTINLTWSGLVSIPAFVVRGRRLTACTTARLTENHHCSELHIKTQSAPRSKHSPSRL